MDDITKKWVKEAGVEQPSAQFSQNVMKAISSIDEKSIAYQPLISKRTWLLLVMTAIGVGVVLYLNPIDNPGWLDNLNIRDQFSFSNPIENISLSKNMFYGLGFMLLFLLQIPFLKRLIVKNYQ